ncbi:MAG: hypothetical protein ACUVV5_03840 [Candidatus Aminicenantales bacterium]
MEKDEEFRGFAQELQDEIMEETGMRSSQVIIDYAQNQRNLGKVENPDGHGNYRQR